MSERWCKRCEQTLPLSAFNKHRKGGHQWWCRECFRTYFRERGDLHRQQVRATKAQRIERAQKHVLDYLTTHPCVDCGEADFVVLEFDHVRGKKVNDVSKIAADGNPIATIDREIAKCDVVCRNCHTIRTLLRKGCDRGRQPRIQTQKPFIRYNLEVVYSVLAHGLCGDCRLKDPRVLEFDHVGPKRKAVMAMAWEGYGIAAIIEEITRCEIRCANCHKRKTSQERNSYRYRATLTA